MRPALSVVIPTFRRLDLLQRCLHGVLLQTLNEATCEVIVVDDGHDHDTQVLVQTWAARAPVALRYVRPRSGKGPAAARNAGWRAALGDVIAFTDDDTIPQPEWLERGLQALQAHGDWSALCGRVVVPLAPQARARPTDHELMTLGLETADFVTANAFVRRRALEQIDGFDEDFKRAWREDSDLQFRLMRYIGPVGHDDLATVLHPVRAERWGVCLRQQRNSFFEALLYKKHRQLYRQFIDASPPWTCYASVISTVGALISLMFNRPSWSVAFGASALACIARITWRRLRPTSKQARHVVEMLATSALIPFLSVYWRLRGAFRFRVFFL